jgi:hypothetical protein
VSVNGLNKIKDKLIKCWDLLSRRSKGFSYLKKVTLETPLLFYNVIVIVQTAQIQRNVWDSNVGCQPAFISKSGWKILSNHAESFLVLEGDLKTGDSVGKVACHQVNI